MNGKSFPRLAAVQWGDGGDTGPLEEAAKKLKEVRNYLFYEVKAEDAVSSRDSKEPANPENMVELRRFLERIEDRLDAVITHHSASEADGRPGPADGPPGASQDAASRDISQAGQAVREKARAARKAVRRTKGIAEDWGRLRDDLSLPKKWDTFRELLDSQEEVEDLLSVLAGRLEEFVRIVSEIGKGGSGRSNAGQMRHRPGRGRVLDGRPHYVPWQPPSAGKAS